MDPRSAYIALNMVEGLGPVKVRALRQALDAVEKICTAPADELIKVPGIGEKLAARISVSMRDIDVCEEIRRAEKIGADIITPEDDDYPDMLRELYDPPLALYIKGHLKPEDQRALAVVGSRHCTSYGLSATDRLAYQMAQTGFTVVSGLARGIDTAAHRGAIKAKGRTIAFLGSALDELYPPENSDLAEAISRTGALISEYPMGRKPDRTTFPYRNRLVSGLALGTLVVEAGPGSGALKTADLALDQGRQLFAVPGRIDSPASRGSNTLIKQGAKLVMDIQDILDEFEFLSLSSPGCDHLSEPMQMPDLSASEKNIIENLMDGAVDIDTLCRMTGLKSHEISGTLLQLEMKRLVKTLPGRMIELNRANRG